MICRNGAALGCLALSSLALTPAPAFAKEHVETLPAATPWNVDWAETYCTLQRKFGSKDDPVLLRMNAFRPGYKFEFYLSGKAIRPFKNRSRVSLAGGQHSPLESRIRRSGNHEKVFLTFGPHAPLEVEYIQNADNDVFGVGIMFSLTINKDPNEKKDKDWSLVSGPYPDPAFEKDIDSVAISSGKRKVIFETGPMQAPLAALRKCLVDLVTQWGLDPEVQTRLTRFAKPVDLQELARSIQKIYPSNLAFSGKQARVNVHAIIDAEGRVTECSVPASYNDPQFNKLACEQIREARFVPALDANGSPVASYWNSTVAYRLN